MKVVLSRAERVALLCVVVVAWYVSPFFTSSGAASEAWGFLHIWDDRENFVENDVIQTRLTFQSVYAMFTLTKINVYEPFGWLLKLLVFQAVGLDSWSVRVVSVALHFTAGFVLAKTSALALDIIEMLSSSNRPAPVDKELSQRHFCGCCLSATIFLVHPIHVEVVAWPSAQPYTLCALFGNLALLTYLKVTARQMGMYITGKMPSMFILVTFLAVTLVSNHQGTHRDVDVLSLSRTERSLKALTTPAWILQRLLWPSKLRPHYQLHSEDLDLASPECQLSIATLLMILVVTLWLAQHRRAPQHFLALVFFLVMLLPVSGLIQHGMVSAGANRYAYLCSVVAVPYGGYALAHWIFDSGVDRTSKFAGMASQRSGQDDGPERNHPQHPQDTREPSGVWSLAPSVTSRYLTTALLLLTATLVSISTDLIGHWRNEDAMYTYSLRMDPSDWRILDQRAEYLMRSGRCSLDSTECERLWELSYVFAPKDTLKSELHRLKLIVCLGDLKRACDGYWKLLELHPDSCHVRNNVAVCLVDRGEISEARQEFVRALQTPGYEYVHSYPKKNLRALDEWVTQKEAQRDTKGAPTFGGTIMF
ncbi:hypothetical protein BBJ28_00021699 [Nothophytophthora sp. Chile5]|nr:hypothetical protein BBJ28_00021699 [Nothophytophthora sp. Chile5]